MRAGRLRHEVRIQAASGGVDEHGGLVEEFSFVATVHASISPLQGRELRDARQVHSDITHEIRIRYFIGLTPKHRILWRDPRDARERIFNILSVQDIDERGEEMVVLAVERVAVTA